MKVAAYTLLAAFALALSGCETDMPPDANAENPVQRGLRGEGSVSARDYSDDPFVRENSTN